MTRLWATALRELRLAWRRPTFWALQVVLALSSGLYLITTRSPISGPDYVTVQVELAAMTLWILLPLLTLPALLRDEGGVGNWLWSSPLRATEHFAGLILGLWLALLPLLVLQVALRWLLGLVVAGAAPDMLWSHGLPLLMVSMHAGLGFITLLAVLLRKTLPVLLIWAGGTLLLEQSAGLRGFNSLSLDQPLNFFLHGIPLSPAIGFGLAQPLVSALSAWLLTLGLLALDAAFIAGFALDRRRTAAPRPLMALVPTVAVLLAVWGFMGQRSAVNAQNPVESPPNIQQDLWLVTEQFLEVDVEARTGIITGQSMLTLSADAESIEDVLVLRLNPGLHLTATSKGVALPVQRLGDSALIDISAIAAPRMQLNLQWRGELYVPHADYGYRERWTFPRFDSPQAVRGLLVDGIGFLLRDGDWYPWPWLSGPRQALATTVLLRVTGHDEVLPASEAEQIRYEGTLPPVLLVLPPPGSPASGTIAIRAGSQAGTYLLATLRTYAEQAELLARALESKPTAHVVALPYLEELYWGDGVLLVPENASPRNPRFAHSALHNVGVQQEVNQRAALVALAHSWLTRHGTPRGVLVRSDLESPSQTQAIRWLETPATPELLAQASGSTPETELAAVATWLALELTPEGVRSADMALLSSVQGSTNDLANMRERLLSSTLAAVPELARWVVQLTEWSAAIGSEQALLIFAQAYDSLPAFSLAALSHSLTLLSGVAVQTATEGDLTLLANEAREPISLLSAPATNSITGGRHADSDQ